MIVNEDLLPAFKQTEPQDEKPVYDPTKAPENCRPVDEIEPIHWDSSYQGMLKRQPHTFANRERFGPELVYYLYQEDHFDMLPGEQRKGLPREQAERVGRGLEECPTCRNTQKVCQLRAGRKTGIRVQWPAACACAAYRQFWREWGNTDNVPTEYRDITLDKLKDKNAGYRDRFEGIDDITLDTIFAAIAAFPDFNILMVGPAGAGKSTLMVALYHEALRKWVNKSFLQGIFVPAVWKVTASQLSKEMIEWANRSREEDGGSPTPPPTVTVSKVNGALHAGHNPHIFIEEFDKYKLSSEFQNTEMHDVLNKAQPNEGRIIADSNHGLERLRAAMPDNHADAKIRRFVGKPRGMLIDFWTKKVYINGVRHMLVNGVLTEQQGDTIAVTRKDSSQQSAPRAERAEKWTDKREKGEAGFRPGGKFKKKWNGNSNYNRYAKTDDGDQGTSDQVAEPVADQKQQGLGTFRFGGSKSVASVPTFPTTGRTS